MLREFVVFQVIVLLYILRCFEKDDFLKEDIHKPSLVEAKASENGSEKFAVALKQNRTMINWRKSKYITNLGTRNYRVLHLAYNPRPVASGCMLSF